jgi:hypothetical protein
VSLRCDAAVCTLPCQTEINQTCIHMFNLLATHQDRYFNSQKGTPALSNEVTKNAATASSVTQANPSPTARVSVPDSPRTASRVSSVTFPTGSMPVRTAVSVKETSSLALFMFRSHQAKFLAWGRVPAPG